MLKQKLKFWKSRLRAWVKLYKIKWAGDLQAPPHKKYTTRQFWQLPGFFISHLNGTDFEVTFPTPNRLIFKTDCYENYYKQPHPIFDKDCRNDRIYGEFQPMPHGWRLQLQDIETHEDGWDDYKVIGSVSIVLPYEQKEIYSKYTSVWIEPVDQDLLKSRKFRSMNDGSWRKIVQVFEQDFDLK